MIDIRLVKKFLMREPFFNDGFEYQFISVEPNTPTSIEIIVNVVLPKKGQSFVVEKFRSDIYDIMDRMDKYLQTGIPYTQKILVDGVEMPKDGLYINSEDCIEVINALNENIKKVVVSNRDYSVVQGEITFFQNKQKTYFYSLDSLTYIDFYILYDVKNIKYNDTPVYVNPLMIEDFAAIINDKLEYSDFFRERIHDIIFSVLNPSLQILNTHLFIVPHYWIDKVNGVKVRGSSLSSKVNFDEEMFNTIS